jgi:hypothetical protein
MPAGSTNYITYNEGVEAKHLHLGNLVHDFSEPNLYEPYVEKAYLEYVHNSLRKSTLKVYLLMNGTALRTFHLPMFEWHS